VDRPLGPVWRHETGHASFLKPIRDDLDTALLEAYEGSEGVPPSTYFKIEGGTPSLPSPTASPEARGEIRSELDIRTSE
jgi:hypothetical protein